MLTFAVPVFAAEEISLTRAVEISIKNNPEISAALFEEQSALFRAKGSRAPANPEILYAPTVAGKDGSDSEALIVQPLEINGSRAVKAKIASSEADSAKFESITKMQSIILQVKNAYWEVVSAQSAVTSAQENIEYLENVRKIIQKQFETGVVPGSRVIKAEVEVSNAGQELMQAEMKLANARAELCMLLNLPQDSDLKLTDAQTFSIYNPDPNQLLAIASDNRSEIKLAQSRIITAKNQLKSARLQSIPDLALQGRKTTMREEGGIAVVVSLPIIDWGSAGNERKSCENLIKAREKECEAAQRKVAVEVSQALKRLKTASGIVVQFRSGTLEKAQQLNKMTQKGYEAGVLNYLELLESHRTMRLTELSYRNALTEYSKALAQLEWAIGSPLPEKTNPEVAK